MSEKQWVDGISGLYVRTPGRGQFKGTKVFCGRVWVKAHGKFRHFVLGTALRKATDRLREIQVDPLAAWEGKKRTEVRMLTFAAMLDAFLKGYTKVRGRSGTEYYREILKPVREHFETTAAGAIQPAELDRYIARRRSLTRNSGARRVSDSTLRKEIVATATCFKWARRNGYVASNPASAESMSRPEENFDPQGVRWLTDDELARLKTGSDAWLRDVIAWATETGMDKGTIQRLRWAALDLDRIDGRIVAGRFAMLRGKTGKPIRQELSAGALEALREAGKVRHASGIVFLDADAQPIDKKVLDWALFCSYKTAKITGCNFRTFRHTYATRALRRGVPREVVAMTMGHSGNFIVERYQHVADDQLREAARRMSGPEQITVPPTVPQKSGAGIGAA